MTDPCTFEGTTMIEPIEKAYLPFSQEVNTIYRYLREDRKEVYISKKIASLNIRLDELLQKPSRDSFIDALNTTEYIMRLLEQLYGSSYLTVYLYRSANDAGKNLVEFLTEHITYKPEHVTSIQTDTANSGDARSLDELYKDANWIAENNREISISLIQRHLRIGYARAGRLLEKLEQDGIIEKTPNPSTFRSLVFKPAINKRTINPINPPAIKNTSEPHYKYPNALSELERIAKQPITEVPYSLKAVISDVLDHAKTLAETINTTIDPQVWESSFSSLERDLTALIPFEKFHVFKGNLPSENLVCLRKKRKSSEKDLQKRIKNAEHQG